MSELPYETIEQVAERGLTFARQGDFSEPFQEILHRVGDGSGGGMASPEGLALKALYHQSRGDIGAAEHRMRDAIQEVRDVFNGVYGEIRPQATPVLIEALGLLLAKAGRPGEQELLADALEAAAVRIRESGYISGR